MTSSHETGTGAPQQRAEGAAKQQELAPIHDFAAKLCQPELLGRLVRYARWQVEQRRRLAEGVPVAEIPALDEVPVSINLDLTTSCNFRCDHCVDMDILNTGERYDHELLLASLRHLAARGLRSVIVIGGGEPTLYPHFEETIRLLKELGLSLGIVTNGSRIDRIRAVADVFSRRDWVRLSLDAGSDELFQAMHRPRRRTSLDAICEGVPGLKDASPELSVGYSFVIVWRGCEANDQTIHENTGEIVLAAERARRYRFDYISFKPFLTRAERNNAEIVGLAQTEEAVDPVMARIRAEVDRAKALETERFRVIESTNLRVLERGTYRDYTRQPATCHMQVFRQVLSPLGLFNCPVYRHVEHARIAGRHGYADPGAIAETQAGTARLLDRFDASAECAEVTCLYNHANWFIEELIRHPERIGELTESAVRGDCFL